MSFTYTVKQGDTLNAISKKYGFSNYKTAGISSVPSGNFNLITPGEKVTLNNYDPKAVGTPLATTPPVISSKDHATQFATNRNNLNDILAGNKPQGNPTPLASTTQDTGTTSTLPTGTTTPTTPPNPDVAGTSITTLYNNSKTAEKVQIANATTQMNTEKTNFLNTINTRLANINSTTKATIDRITSLAQSRIDEQTSINNLNTDRIKAYGLANGGLYEPVQYTSAVTQKETQGAQAISKIERMRDTAISQAEIASRQGKSALLSQKMDTIDKFNSDLQSNLISIENESAKQYNMLIQVRKEKQAENIKAIQDMQKRITAYVELNSQEYKKMTPAQISEKITQVMTQTNMGYSQVYNAFMAGINGSATNLKTEKTQAEINKLNAQTKTETTKQYKNIQEANKQSTKVDANTTLNKFAENFVHGKSIPILVNGKKSLIPVLDSNGNVTPEAWKSAISQSSQLGVSRDQFLTRFGHFIVAPDGTVSTKFNLTPGELKKIHATERGVPQTTSGKAPVAIQ